MFGWKKRKAAQQPTPEPKPEEKPTPAYLRDDYPYKAIGDPIEDMSTLKDTGVVYEIRCPKCETTIRSQGRNIRSTYERLMSGNGCLGCGNKELIVKEVDMSKAPKVAPVVPTAAEEPADTDASAAGTPVAEKPAVEAGASDASEKLAETPVDKTEVPDEPLAEPEASAADADAEPAEVPAADAQTAEAPATEAEAPAADAAEPAESAE